MVVILLLQHLGRVTSGTVRAGIWKCRENRNFATEAQNAQHEGRMKPKGKWWNLQLNRLKKAFLRSCFPDSGEFS